MQRSTAPGAVHPAFLERAFERDEMVKNAIEAGGVTDPRVLAAMRGVPRHRFVPHDLEGEAYANRPLPIGHAQTISQPIIVAVMTELAAPMSTDRCLEIGTGSGYQAAVLAELCQEVYSIEYLPEIAKFGEENLHALGYLEGKVVLKVGNGYGGWPEHAPFDVIVVTAAPTAIPHPLLQQLAIGGRLVIPVGPDEASQRLELWRRLSPGDGDDAFERRELMGVRFVPLVGPKPK